MKNVQELLCENKAWIEETFKQIDDKMKVVTVRSRDILADGVDANHRHIGKHPNGWTSGFWGGLNYLLYEYTKNEEYLKTARNIEQKMDVALGNFMALHHDVGFMWHILSGANYKLFGDEKSKVRNLYAASTLFSRFVPSGGFIRAWNGAGDWGDPTNWTIIDCMMNLPQLFFASEIVGDDRFKQVAIAHADMTLMDHVREDGSVAHIVEHDRETGEVVKFYGGQGVGPDTSWSRGQAWGVYGFALAYIHTKEQRYLDCAKRVAHYFIANCCDDWLPRSDFRAPSTPVYYDMAASAIAACGLIEIAKLVDENEGGMYMSAAINLLKAIKDNFMDLDPDHDEMVTHATRLYPVDGNLEKSGVHISIIYADYYYTEAILKLLGSEFLPW